MGVCMLVQACLPAIRTICSEAGEHSCLLLEGRSAVPSSPSKVIVHLQAVEPNPAQPGGFRLRVKMQLVRSSLWIQVAETSIGYISADHLQVCPITAVLQ